MAISIANLTFDCSDPERVAAFWSAALALPLDDGASEFFASIGMSTSEITPNWLFLKVPEAKAAKNRFHLDFESDDPAAEVRRLVELGATHVADKDEWGHQWSVMNDVEGNEFCVSGPHSEAG